MRHNTSHAIKSESSSPPPPPPPPPPTPDVTRAPGPRAQTHTQTGGPPEKDNHHRAMIVFVSNAQSSRARKAPSGTHNPRALAGPAGLTHEAAGPALCERARVRAPPATRAPFCTNNLSWFQSWLPRLSRGPLSDDAKVFRAASWRRSVASVTRRLAGRRKPPDPDAKWAGPLITPASSLPESRGRARARESRPLAESLIATLDLRRPENRNRGARREIAEPLASCQIDYEPRARPVNICRARE